VWGAGFTIPAGGKTGTTNDGTNVWFVGYTADIVAGVWMGLDRPQKIISNAQGGRLAAPAWTAFMQEVYRRKPKPPDWPRPQGFITRDIDVSTGLLQTPYCPRELIGVEFFIPGTEPTRECDKHYSGSTFGTPDYTTPQTGNPYPPIDTFARPPARTTPTPNPSRVIPGAAPVPIRSRDSSRFRPTPKPDSTRILNSDSLQRTPR
jgi:penicillin-binding protein 1A